MVKAAVTAAQSKAREGAIAPGEVAEEALRILPRQVGSLSRVLNATGVVVHTNLGRAPLSGAAREAVLAASGYADVEFDLVTGTRAVRGRGTLDALREAVPNAEDVHVVNNCAAALMLTAAALARDREIVVSRGEMVEIGDGFRLPDLLAASGATLREVGTTNRTHLADYQNAVGPETGFVLKVHPSNYRVSGFTSSVSVGELATLDVPVVFDIGSGLLQADPLLADEPDATGALRDGAALVMASADKLLGGPQAGLILGESTIVQRLRRHPLARAVRVDKLTLAALEATLRGPEPPATAALHADPAQLRARAEALAAALRHEGVDAAVVDSEGAVGGGAGVGVELPGVAVSLPETYAAPLRRGDPAVVGRTERGRCLLDLRCIGSHDDDVVARAVIAVSVS
jgi:L-seryl-tRNA(Ser) seleniumtransferase